MSDPTDPDVQDGSVPNGGALVPDEERLSYALLPRTAAISLTVDQLAGKFRAYGSRNWDQACQAAVRQACAWTGGAPTPNYLSANEAFLASTIISKNAASAPRGAIHYWAIGSFGHVAGGLGGSSVFMASRHIDHAWATNLGTTTVATYTMRTGATYRGWARTNGHNKLKLRADAAPHPTKGQKFTLAKAGEGFIAIAARVGVSADTLVKLNPKINPSKVALGQRVRYA